MTDSEKIKKFEAVQKLLWDNARDGQLMQSMFSASLIRVLDIPSPEGDDPESA